MRRLGALILCLGLSTPTFAQTGDQPPAEETSVPWYRWLFLGERPKKPGPPKPAAAASDTPKPAAKPAAVAAKEAAARSFAEEHRVFLERLKAIDRIRSIAHQQGDEELLKKTYDLEEQAELVFKQRTAKLPNPADDRAILERGRDDRPATADRSNPRQRNNRGGDR
ncbi:MAG TPA: hypothetical protein VKD71_04325 [Gemmataceae bacterium]|nr:hypothetical protein [Gemmataceae bacterium]